MRAGSLTSRLEVQEETRVKNGSGGYTSSWVKLKEIWALVRPASGRDLYWGQMLQQRITHTVTLRFDADITAKHRFRFGSRILRILSVVNLDERGKEQTCLCEETS